MRKSGMFFILALGMLAAATAAAGDCGKPCPAECPQAAPCCEKVKKTCVRIDAKKTVTHTHYSCKEDEICKDRCSSCLFSRKSCDGCKNGCDSDSCGKVRTRRKLVKKIVTEEVCITKCVPVAREDSCVKEKPCRKLFSGWKKPCAQECAPAAVECAPSKTSEALPNPPKTADPMKK